MKNLKVLLLIILVLVISACTRQAHTAPYINFSKVGSGQTLTPTFDPYLPPTRIPDQPVLTPTPNAPRPLPTLRTDDIFYTVQWGDTIKTIAFQYNILPEQIIDANQISNPSLIFTGQQLLLPAPKTSEMGPDFKIIPDSELVRGPYSVRFEIEAYINNQTGYLKEYQTNVEGEDLSASEIVSKISQDYSVNPRLLLALIEYQSGWLTGQQDLENLYPLGYREFGYEGLYWQLAWAADELNRGYYLWKVKGVGSWTTKNGITVPINPTINAGSAGVQNLFALLLPYDEWIKVVNKDGFVQSFIELFGYPFDLTYSPLIPSDLTQPELQLPFEEGVTWLFSGGPHGGWDTGSAWAALDFAPFDEDLGCRTSDDWVVAVADGIITRADHGAIVQSIDGDPYDQTGWSILYMHIDMNDSVKIGTNLLKGEKVGHPSCEGGVSTGTHLHIARRYNGEWISADQDLPFIMDGWVSQGSGYEYQGQMIRGDQSVRAEDTKTDFNRIKR
jgi:murein DD-endopeptidase MepM/ murein hydrolase activator NlpD